MGESTLRVSWYLGNPHIYRDDNLHCVGKWLLPLAVHAWQSSPGNARVFSSRSSAPVDENLSRICGAAPRSLQENHRNDTLHKSPTSSTLATLGTVLSSVGLVLVAVCPAWFGFSKRQHVDFCRPHVFRCLARYDTISSHGALLRIIVVGILAVFAGNSYVGHEHGLCIHVGLSRHYFHSTHLLWGGLFCGAPISGRKRAHLFFCRYGHMLSGGDFLKCAATSCCFCYLLGAVDSSATLYTVRLRLTGWLATVYSDWYCYYVRWHWHFRDCYLIMFWCHNYLIQRIEPGE